METYYVKNEGNDANDGLSHETAWATVDLVNNSIFNPGDSVLFNRGDFWNENLIPQYSGDIYNNIVFGAYGTGDKPIISGMREVPGWDNSGNWTEGESNQWTMAWSTTRHRQRIWINDDEKARSQTFTVSESNPWQWHDDILYIYSVGNPATTYTSITTPNYDHFLGRHQTAGVEYITIQDIEVNGWYSSRLYGPFGWIIQRCTWGKYFALDGIRIIVDEENNRQATNCKIRYNEWDSYCRLPEATSDLTAIDPSYTGGYTTEDGLIITAPINCEIHDNNISYWAHTNLSIRGSGTYMVEGLKVYRNYITTIGTNNGRGVGGFAYLNYVNPDNPVEFHHNILDRCSNSSTFDIPYGKFYNNIYYGARGRGDDPSRSAHGLRLTGRIGNPEYMKIYNNIFANNKGHGLEFRHDSSYNNIANNIFANNIFYNNEGYNFTWSDGVASNVQFNADAGSVNIHDNEFYNNLFYSSETPNVVRVYGSVMDIDSFNALTGSGDQGHITADNIQGDPLFVDFPDSYKIQEASPAIQAGYPETLSPEDYYGNLWTNPPNIGVDGKDYSHLADLITDAQGKASKRLAPGLYAWKVAKTGYVSQEDSIEVGTVNMSIPVNLVAE